MLQMTRHNSMDVDAGETNKKLPRVNSFDVFDTILARRVLQPSDIFDIVEKNFPFEGYAQIRKEAEKINGLTFDTIFKEFKRLSGCDDAIITALREFEIETECANCYLIASNNVLVQDGDILVSDMYMLDSEIRTMLRRAGFDKNVVIYSSSSGMSKCSGSMYKFLLERYDIASHSGDNPISDIVMAQKYQIRTRQTRVSAVNATEHFFHVRNKIGLAQMLREFRLQNPYLEKSYEYALYEDQIVHNIPILFMLSYNLSEMMRKENLSLLLLLTRDGCLLYEIFRTLFPNINCCLLQSSRRMHNFANDDYKQYLKEHYIPGHSLIFDLHGSFQSGRVLYRELFGQYPRVHLFTYCGAENALFDTLTFSFLASNDYIERFNSDVIGTLLTMRNGEFARRDVEVEYSYDDAMIYRNCVLSFCQFIMQPRFAQVLQDETVGSDLRGFYESNRERRPHIHYRIPPEIDVLNPSIVVNPSKRRGFGMVYTK